MRDRETVVRAVYGTQDSVVLQCKAWSEHLMSHPADLSAGLKPKEVRGRITEQSRSA